MGKKGHGPTILGLAACNDPHITGMDRLRVVDVGGKKFIKAQGMRFGRFRHPRAPGGVIESNQGLYDSFFENFRNGTVDRALFFDPAHKVDQGSLGELVELTQEGEKLFLKIDPTPEGLEAVESKKWNYASLHFHYDWQPNEVLMRATELDEIVDIQLSNDEETDMKGKDENGRPADGEPEDGAAEDVELTETPNPEPAEGDNEPVGDDVSLSDSELSDERIIELRAEYEREVKAMKDERAALARELELAREQRLSREAEMWSESVELFLENLAKPDKDGNAVCKPAIELARSILLGEDISIGKGDGEVTLSLSSANTDVDRRDYYRRAVMQLMRVIPRNVPAGEPGVEKRDLAYGNRSDGDIDLTRRWDAIVSTAEINGMSREDAEKKAQDILGVTKEEIDAS